MIGEKLKKVVSPVHTANFLYHVLKVCAKCKFAVNYGDILFFHFETYKYNSYLLRKNVLKNTILHLLS